MDTSESGSSSIRDKDSDSDISSDDHDFVSKLVPTKGNNSVIKKLEIDYSKTKDDKLKKQKKKSTKKKEKSAKNTIETRDGENEEEKRIKTVRCWLF